MDTQHLCVVKVEDAFVSILSKQRVEHGSGWSPYLLNTSRFLTFRRARYGSAAWHRKRHDRSGQMIEVLTQFRGDDVKVQTLGFQLFDNRLFALNSLPTP